MQFFKRFIHCCVLSLLCSQPAFTQDTAWLPVHFLYGSRPAPGYKTIEKKWFGGRMGGHVGIQIDSDNVLNFVHHGRYHVISRQTKKIGKYILTSQSRFNSILGGDSDKVKTLTILIPVTSLQLKKLDSLAKNYLQQSPYDYAFFGMRCAAASYEILSQLDILPKHSHTKIARKIFYPKLLRKELLKKAEANGWAMVRQQGANRRIWETD